VNIEEEWTPCQCVHGCKHFAAPGYVLCAVCRRIGCSIIGMHL